MKKKSDCVRCNGTRMIKRRRWKVDATVSTVYLDDGFLIETHVPDKILIGGDDACPDCVDSAEFDFGWRRRKPVTDFPLIEKALNGFDV